MEETNHGGSCPHLEVDRGGDKGLEKTLLFRGINLDGGQETGESLGHRNVVTMRNAIEDIESEDMSRRGLVLHGLDEFRIVRFR